MNVRVWVAAAMSATLIATPALADAHKSVSDAQTISDELDAIVLKQPPPEDVFEYPEYVVQRQYEIYQAYTRELYTSQFRSMSPIYTVDLPSPFAPLSQQPGFYRVTGTEPTPELYTDDQ
ncbi:MAG: hypothetical protein AAF704_11755 [Cyanobacteria bacterium P01_D01_bin.123]